MTALGSSLHEILSKLKSQPNKFPNIDTYYSPTEPLSTPVILNLPQNGFRLRFDGTSQRLRLIEVLDFSFTPLTYDNKDVVKIGEGSGATKGPAFRHVYDRLIGPTFPGEYMPPKPDSGIQTGQYILSYPGIAFTFPLQDSAWSKGLDFVSLLSSPSAAPANSLAIYDGASWQEARHELYTRRCPNPRSFTATGRGKDLRPDEVDHVVISPDGRLDIMRRNVPPFKLVLGRTTPQDLVAELGPPDAIHRKSDRRLSIHKTQHGHRSGATSSGYDSADTDRSSHAATDESDVPEEKQRSEASQADTGAECFYNYFHHGFDIFISHASPIPKRHHFSNGNQAAPAEIVEPDQLVATKVLLNGNIPGSYPFNRYRRCRWVVDHPLSANGDDSAGLTSEMPFSELSDALRQVDQSDLGAEARHANFQQGMVLNRGWGNSPGSSCELLGGWEESEDKSWKRNEKAIGDEGPGLGNTELFGFPGLVFEVLKNDTVSCLTVY